MPSTRELRRRIKSVKSTRQITKAMELVSAAKMRRASEATIASRPYALRAFEVLRDLTDQPLDALSHPLIDERPIAKEVVFLVSSDRGLAGSYNTNLFKLAVQFWKDEQALGREVHFITMGKIVEQALLRVGATVVQSYPHSPTHPSSSDILPLSSFLSESFLNGSYDRAMVLYTEFHSLLRQETSIRQLLPLLPSKIEQELRNDQEFLDAESAAHQAGQHYFMYEPTPEQVLDYVLPRLVDVQLYQSLQESLASEHSSRRLAMKNATDNASDVIDDLTLTYNSVRQGTITREIAEITSGAAALEG